MKEIKRTCKWFDITEYEKEAEYLREMHIQGWKFLKFTIPSIYKFEKCEPEDVIYQLDYNKEGNEHKAEYLQMFSDCGWEYIGETVGYSYFRKPISAVNGDDEEIFCDESSRLAMMERVYKGRLTPLLVIFCACLLPQFVLNLTNERYGLAAFMGGVLALYIVIFGYCTAHYYRKKNK